MKRFFIMVIVFLLMGNCGRIKNTILEETFTKEEKVLFSNAVKRYQNENLNNLVQISGYSTDTLLLVNALWFIEPTDPEYGTDTTLKYKFTKKNLLFTCNSYKGEKFVKKTEGDNLDTLLRTVLK